MTKRAAAWSLLVLVLLGTPAFGGGALANTNLLANPSFEETAGAGTNESLVPGWKLHFRLNEQQPDLAPGEVVVVDDPAQARSGRRCLKLQPSKDRQFYGIEILSSSTQDHVYEPGIYEMGAWLRARPGTLGTFGVDAIDHLQTFQGIRDQWTRNRLVRYFRGGKGVNGFNLIVWKEAERGQLKDPVLVVDDLSLTRRVSGLADVFGDHMVLQRDKPVPVFGWTIGPSQPVVLKFNGQTKTITSDKDGRWEVTLAPMKAGGPYELELDGGIAAFDVMVGDVWICSGQSNMEMGVGKIHGIYGEAPEVLAQATNPMIRLWHAAKTFSPQPARSYPLRQDVWYHRYQACWNVCGTNTLGRGGWGGFSGVGYFFGREIQADQKVAIGLMQVANGGTAIEAWMSEEALKPFPPASWACPPMDRMAADKVAIAPMPAVPEGLVPAYAEQVAVTEGAAGHGAYNYASACFNSLLAPVFPMAAKGVLWYQGEHNSADPLYEDKLKAMIADWRARARDPELPFIISQLCNWKTADARQNFAITREGQRQVSRSVPDTALVVTIDLADRDGEPGFPYGPAEIHPHRKQEVGERNALAARELVYGERVVGSGPAYTSCQPEKGRLRLRFDSVGGGLVARGGALAGFTVAGEDQQFVPADAVIEGKSVVVSAAGVANPVAARYGFAQFVDPLCNLYNEEGLPASPFRTDDWPLK